jgi:hypothetical protein
MRVLTYMSSTTAPPAADAWSCRQTWWPVLTALFQSAARADADLKVRDRLPIVVSRSLDSSTGHQGHGRLFSEASIG